MSVALCSLLLLAASTLPDDVENAVQRMLDGHARMGRRPLFPEGADVAGVEQQGLLWVVRVDGDFAHETRDEVLDELRRETLMGALDAARVDGGVELLVRDAHGAWVPLFPLQPDVPAVKQARPQRRDDGAGALSGRRIALSAGHGWLNQNGSWETQRSRWDFTGCANCRGITEDFFTADLMTNFVIPLLQRMGATVVVVREPDHATVTPLLLTGGTESGAWSAGTNGNRSLPQGSNGEVAFSVVTTGSAEFRAGLRFAGGMDRTGSALLRIEDLGGAHDVVIDQRRNGDAWLDVGPFWFGEGSRITLSRAMDDGILDVTGLKIGGGMFADSGKPWWQMGAKSYVPYATAPSTVTTLNDVTIRPAYAEYVDADVFVSIHANASGATGGSSANGLSIYRYSCQMYGDHTSSAAATACDDPPRSTQLEDLLHQEILGRIHADWDPNFGNRGKLVANFGELRVLDDIPGVLIETAFFDNIENPSGNPAPRYADNRTLHDPRWREAFAYGVAAGLAKFFDAQAGAPPTRPDGLAAINKPDATLEVSWSAVAGATKYRVYTARHRRAFDAGVDVEGTSLLLEDATPGTVLTFRVAAMNGNGEGLPSQAVSARFRGAHMPRPAHALIMASYDRRDAWVQEIDNDFMYSVEHAQGLAAATGMDIYFDGALDEAVESTRIPIAGYRLIDVETGKDSTADRPVSKTMQGMLAAYVGLGGALLISGEEVGYALVRTSSDPDDQSFMHNVLSADYVEDDADTYTMRGTQGGPFSMLGDVTLDDGTGGVFEVVYPDVIAPFGSATKVLEYPDGRAAAVATAHTIFVAAPIEAVVPELSRNALFDAAAHHLLPGVGQGDLDEDGASDACETMYGFDPRNFADGALDADDDGKTNARECQDGTNPVERADAGATMDAGQPPMDASVSTEDAGTVDASVPDDAGVTDPPDAAVTTGGGGGGDAPPANKERKIGPFTVPSCGCGVSTDSDAAPLGLLALAALMLRRKRR